MSEAAPPGVPTKAQTTNPDLAEPGRPGLVGRFKRLSGPIAGLVGRLKRLRGPIVAVAAVGAVLSGFVGYWNAYRTVRESAAPAAWQLPPLLQPTPVRDSPPPLSIAVLPFATASESADDRQFAEELSNDVTTGLGRYRAATVSPHRLATTYTAKTIDLSAVARDLNVRYIAEGEIRRVGERVTVAVRLTDARNRKQTWSDRLEYDRATLSANPMAAQLQLTYRLRRAMVSAEKRRAVAETGSLTPMDHVLQGYATWDAEPGVKGLRGTRKQAEAALRLDPNFVPALTLLTETYEEEFEYGPNPDQQAFEQKMDALSGRAVSIDPNDADAWYARSMALSFQGRWDEALSASERAESLNPSEIKVLLWRSWITLSTGHPADTVALAQRAATIEPTAWAQLMTCKGYLFLGRYRDAVAACEKSAGLNNFWVDEVYLTAAYAQVGETGKAKIARDELLNQQPAFTIDRYRKTWFSGTPAFFELVETHLAAGLRKAGIPEN